MAYAKDYVLPRLMNSVDDGNPSASVSAMVNSQAQTEVNAIPLAAILTSAEGITRKTAKQGLLLRELMSSICYEDNLSSVEIDAKPDNNEKPEWDDADSDSTPPDGYCVSVADNNDILSLDNMKPAWDVAQNIPRERISSTESFSGFVKCLKLFTYFFIFVMIWLSATVGTGCFLVLISALRHGDINYSLAKSQLIAIMVVPYILIFVISFTKAVFGRIPFPSIPMLCGVVLVEVLHNFGVVTLVLRVMPCFGGLYGLGLMHSVFLVPSFVAVLFERSERHKSNHSHLARFTWLLDVIAMLLSGVAVALPIVVASASVNNTAGGQNATTVSPASNSFTTDRPQRSFASDVRINRHLVWEFPVALILVSVKWWENFVGEDRGYLKLFKVKRMLHVVRVKADIITSLMGIGAIFASIALLEYLYKQSTGSFMGYVELKTVQLLTNSSFTATNATQSQIVNETVLTWTPGIVCVACGLICYYMSSLACKLLMQRVSFCLPLILAPPTVAGVILLQCYGVIQSTPITIAISFEFLCDINMDHHGYYVIAAALWYLVFLWICRHIWFPHAERIAKTNKLFVTTLYTGVLFTQSIIINRRRNDRELRKSGKGKLGTNSETTSVITGSESPGMTLQNPSFDPHKRQLKVSSKDGPIPMIYACATMWHETSNEMIQLLKSMFRMDADQCARRIAQEVFKVKDPDYYEFEGHIFFDDCMDFNDNDEWVCNSFVKELVQVIDEAARYNDGYPEAWIYQFIESYVASETHPIYDSNSEVMYMYYLLAYRLFGEGSDYVTEYLNSQTEGSENSAKKPTRPSYRRMPTWLERAKLKQNKRVHVGKSSVFETMEESLVDEAENTFLLALDGDVDFKPDAVRLLVDRMKKNQKTGASCGRIHPIGTGPLVWYQMFEYAIGHWFQKATEHVLGCVLCSPGCFSLFRGSALLDDNVMKKYTTQSTEARHFMQYDQGEDRWLCTLLLQQGYRVDYSAAADALTYCPEGFDEFFNQRRRWVPSTLANIWDLLSDSTNTVLINDNISQGYMLYQFLLMMSTILGPATIIITIASAIQEIFYLGSMLWAAYLLALIPPAFYIVVCFLTKPATQLIVAKILCTMYAGVMIVVLVGLIINLSSGYILNPSSFFLTFVACSFVLAGVVHPYEFFCLIHGFLYFVCIPSGFLIMMIYSMCNMHVVSWGTREVPKRKTKKQTEADSKNPDVAEKKKNKGLFSYFRGATNNFMQEIKSMLMQIFQQPSKDDVSKEILKELQKLRKQLKRASRSNESPKTDQSSSSSSDFDSEPDRPDGMHSGDSQNGKTVSNGDQKQAEPDEEVNISDEDPNNPLWIRDAALGDGAVEFLDVEEVQFWKLLIQKYLEPIKKDTEVENKIQRDLIEMRNSSSFGLWMVNLIWILLNFMLQLHLSPITLFVRSDGVPVKCEPLGFVFIVFFFVVLLLQVIGMLKHRWGTFLEVMTITELTSPFARWAKRRVLEHPEQISVKEALCLTRKTMRLKSDLPESESIFEDEPDEFEMSNDPGKVIAHLQDEAFNLSILDPRSVRRTLRRHFGLSQTNRQHPNDCGQEPLPLVNEIDAELGLDRGFFSDSSNETYKYSNYEEKFGMNRRKLTWKSTYVRRLQASTLRNRHGSMSFPIQAESHVTNNGRVEEAAAFQRNPRFIRSDELERVFSQRLRRMSVKT